MAGLCKFILKTQRAGCQAPETPSVHGISAGLTTKRFSQTRHPHEDTEDPTVVMAAMDMPTEEIKATRCAICLRHTLDINDLDPWIGSIRIRFDLRSWLSVLFWEKERTG